MTRLSYAINKRNAVVRASGEPQGFQVEQQRTVEKIRRKDWRDEHVIAHETQRGIK